MVIGGGVSDWFKKVYNMGTRAYDFVKDKQEDFYGRVLLLLKNCWVKEWIEEQDSLAKMHGPPVLRIIFNNELAAD